MALSERPADRPAEPSSKPPAKPTKRWLIILSIPVGLIIVVVLGLKLYFNSDRLKALVVPPIEKATKHDVTVGDIYLSFIPSIAIEVDNLNIYDPNSANLDKDYSVQLDRLRLKVNLMALIHSIGNPDNFKFSAGSRIELPLSDIEIHNAQVTTTDKKQNSRMIVDGFDMKAHGEVKSEDNTVVLALQADIAKFSYGTMTSLYANEIPISLKTDLTFDSQQGILTLNSTAIKVRELPIDIHGTVSNLYLANMNMNLLISAPGATMDQVLSLVPPDMLKAAQGLTSSGNVSFSMVVKGDSGPNVTPGVTGQFGISDGRVQYQSLPKAITNINVSGSFDKPAGAAGSKAGGDFAVDKFGATLGGDQISGSLHVSNFASPIVSAKMNASLNLGEVKNFYPLQAGTEVGGKLTSSISIDGPASTPAQLNASGSMDFADVTIKTAGSAAPLQHLQGSITFNNQMIQSRGLSLSVGQSDMTLSFALSNYLGMVMASAEKGGKPNASITLTSKQFRIADITTAPPTPATSGSSTAAEAAQAPPPASSSPTESAPTPKPAASTGKSGATASTAVPAPSAGKARKGFILPGIDLTANMTVGKFITDKFEFDNVKGSLSISNGVITLQNFSLNAFGGGIVTKGTLDLRDTLKKPFDLTLNMNNVDSHEALSKFSSFGDNLQGKITLNTKLKGDLDDTLGLDKQTLQGDGTMSVADGKIQNFALMNKIAAMTNKPEYKELDFKSWSGEFTIVDGKMTLKDNVIHSPAADYTIGGVQGLDGSMDYSINMKLSKDESSNIGIGGIGGEIVQALKDKDGRITIVLKVGGTMSSPTVTPDLDAAKKAALNNLKGQNMDQLKKKAGDILKGLIHH